MRKIQFDGQEYTVEQYREMVETIITQRQKRMCQLLKQLNDIANQPPWIIKEEFELEPLKLPRYTLELKMFLKKNLYPDGYFRYVEVGKEDNESSSWESWSCFYGLQIHSLNKTHDYEPDTVYRILQQLDNYCAYIQRLGDEIHSKRVELIESQREGLEHIISEYTLHKMANSK